MSDTVKIEPASLVTPRRRRISAIVMGSGALAALLGRLGIAREFFQNLSAAGVLLGLLFGRRSGSSPSRRPCNRAHAPARGSAEEGRGLSDSGRAYLNLLSFSLITARTSPVVGAEITRNVRDS